MFIFFSSAKILCNLLHAIHPQHLQILFNLHHYPSRQHELLENCYNPNPHNNNGGNSDDWNSLQEADAASQDGVGTLVGRWLLARYSVRGCSEMDDRRGTHIDIVEASSCGGKRRRWRMGEEVMGEVHVVI